MREIRKNFLLLWKTSNDMENLPQDVMMLMSFVNTKLRDEYATLDELCASLDVDRSWIEARLAEGGFEYNPQLNKFW